MTSRALISQLYMMFHETHFLRSASLIAFDTHVASSSRNSRSTFCCSRCMRVSSENFDSSSKFLRVKQIKKVKIQFGNVSKRLDSPVFEIAQLLLLLTVHACRVVGALSLVELLHLERRQSL